MIWLFAGAMALAFLMHIVGAMSVVSLRPVTRTKEDDATGQFLIGGLDRLDRALHDPSDDKSI